MHPFTPCCEHMPSNSPACCLCCRAPGAGAEVVGGPTAGYVPQGPGQEPPGVADVDISAAHQLAQLLR